MSTNRLHAWDCATCGKPIRALDGGVSGSNLPAGVHHGMTPEDCQKAAATDYSACFDVAWHFMARAKTAYDRYLQATMDDEHKWSRAELDVLLADVQGNLWEGVQWGYYPRHGKPPTPHEPYIHSDKDRRENCLRCNPPCIILGVPK